MNVRGRPRVLLVEDDASLQRFVQLALEDFDLELKTASSVEEGLAELGRAPVALILTDLMLPGRSGFELIDALSARPELLAGARLVVFSAGLNPQTRQRLERPEVWRLLSKPCGLAELEGCVRDALAHRDAPQPPPCAEPAAGPGSPARPGPAEEAGDEQDQRQAIAEHFGGNAPLYKAFRASCLQQFRADLAEGDRALDSADAQALRRLAHSLKSVLLTLGHASASDLARALEQTSEQADWPRAGPQWHSLRDALLMLR